ncbi:MAG: hypothetical protein A3K19_04795 [Lentisphaerae bacterium RIFOXYB12_FULL_65_16]|nr:MAG: hypothetical protein A3K18_11530 [Lentisphaerae bacterium RIFOXYA12_64_32]OGV84049.1 MAG: hypothetical protein A3K19_04795 [Lentisphaerae bacterium RIFOXYB12_FULL_65_16]
MKPKADELIEFFHQLALLVRANMPLPDSLAGLAGNCRNPAFAHVVQQLADDVAHGLPLSDAVARHGRCFDTFHVQLLRAGERSGTLGEVLTEIARIARLEHALRTRVKEVAAYPVLTVSMAVAVLLLVLRFLFPELAATVQDMYENGVPALSGLLFAAADWVKAYWWGCVAVYLTAVGAVIWVFAARPGSNDPLRRCIRALPGAQRIFANHDMARASGILAVLVRHQTPLDQALSTAADLTDSPGVGRALRELAAAVRSGAPIGRRVEAAHGLDPLLLSCLAHFPENELPGELEQVREAFTERANTATVRCAAVWGSVACTAMALLVGAVVLAMFMPLIELDRWLHVMG